MGYYRLISMMLGAHCGRSNLAHSWPNHSMNIHQHAKPFLPLELFGRGPFPTNHIGSSCCNSIELETTQASWSFLWICQEVCLNDIGLMDPYLSIFYGCRHGIIAFDIPNYYFTTHHDDDEDDEDEAENIDEMYKPDT